MTIKKMLEWGRWSCVVKLVDETLVLHCVTHFHTGCYEWASYLVNVRLQQPEIKPAGESDSGHQVGPAHTLPYIRVHAAVMYVKG